MNKLLVILLSFYLFSCGEESQFKNQKPVLRKTLELKEFDYQLPDKNLPIEYHEFDTLDLSID
jgi:hypothetical protein